MGRGGSWGAALAIALALVGGALSAHPTSPSTGVPGPATTVTIRVDEGTSVTIWERTTDTNVLTYSVATLTGSGGTFDSLANEHYTFTSDGAYVKIQCFRPAHGEGTGTGNNIEGVRLDGVPGYPSGLWASEIVDYTVGYGGIESSRFAALGDNLSDFTFMGDQDSELVLAFTVDQVENRAPTIASFGATPAPEGSAVTFTATASDPDGDSLTYSFDFESDGTWDASGPDPSATHVFGDDFSGTATVRVSDGRLSEEATTAVSVSNVAPVLSIGSTPSGAEGAPVAFQVRVTDPGSDDLMVAWTGECGGWSAPRSYPNDPSRFPDPRPSPDVHARDESDSQTVVCGDDGEFAWNVRAEDDDGGVTTVSGTVLVANLPPEFAHTFCPQIVGCIPTRDEGARTDYSIVMEDPGSDDLTTSWSWGDGMPAESATHFNDGSGPDPRHSPAGAFPFDVQETRTHAYGDDGEYDVRVDAADDDGGGAFADATVTILNVPPGLTPAPPSLVALDEGVGVTLRATATDPGSDDLTFTWSWDFGPTESRTDFNDGVGPDPSPSPGGTFPFLATDSSTHVYGDDCTCLVTLVVSDDDGGSLTYTTTIQVANAPPAIRGAIAVTATANVTLRVAGEKWHDVSLTLYDGAAVAATASVVRMPGSPEAQAVTVEGFVFDLLSAEVAAVLEYTPLDDPVNGQPNGADSAWLILTAGDGTEVRIHHTFNVRHPDTWTWTVGDVRALLVGFPIRFEGFASDPGSDDLMFTWSWGDGSPNIVTTYFNDGLSPDRRPSPDVRPMAVTNIVTHSFAASGTYSAILRVVDDDGGIAIATVAVNL